MSVAGDLTAQRLRTEEGFRAIKYKDSKGLETVGYGLNLTIPQPERVWFAAMRECVAIVEEDLAKFDWYSGLNDARKSVIIDMAFNMGLPSLLHFVNTLAAVARGDWQAAHDGILNSQYARDVGQRAQHLAQIMLTGELNV